ncbi:MAG: glycosyltransferase family 4 protein [Anaerolineaceae bacterium]|nr:glycosyltransferase family 4 protein [Anaerolineaceae bacterium]
MTKILVIADGRSTTARSWIAHLRKIGYQVSLVSTYPYQPMDGVSEAIVLPLALSRFNKDGVGGVGEKAKPGLSARIKKSARVFIPLYRKLRSLIGPFTIRAHTTSYLDFLAKVQPDLVHALRIPFEGMLGSATPESIPFLVATWGNDLTLHAVSTPWMKKATRRCLERADGLTSDTQRDIRLAHKWGLSADAPTLTVPGSGGLDLAGFDRISAEDFNPEAFNLPTGVPWVVNPRGIRPGSLHQEEFFAAIPKILAEAPETVFICPALAGVREAEGWVAKWNIVDQTHLLPKLNQTQLFALFKRSQVFVSPASHDGTPNSLLEAIACGCYPVVGRIESLEDWITEGINGALVDPRDSDSLAQAILTALRSPEMRAKAAEVNRQILLERAADQATLPAIAAFYAHFLP